MVEVYIVVHLTTTCDENGVYVTKDSSETIEFTWIMMHSKTLQEIHKQSILIRPLSTPITPLCTSLTTLTWDHVKNAGSFSDCIRAFDLAVQEYIINHGNDISFVSLNSWDLRVQIQREARDKNVVLPAYLKHPKIYDIRKEYSRWQQHHPETVQCSASSISGICTALEVPENPVGNLYNISQPTMMRPRRAIEDVTLAANILKALIIKSQPFEQHSDVMTRPMDLLADVRAFLQEKSKVVHLSNLPHDITQSELESWFTQYGGRPIAFWTFRTPDNSHSNLEAGFAVFSTHEEAAESLAMNGRALNERAIEVSPSGNAVIERARNILTHFPSSKNRPRPGDWICPSCGFSNFQRRTACFRCSFQTSDASNTVNNHHHHDNSTPGNKKPSGGSQNGGSGVPFRAGDWKCAKDGCNYHNFAKNMFCLRCGASRSAAAIADPHPSNAARYFNANLIYGGKSFPGHQKPPKRDPAMFQMDM